MRSGLSGGVVMHRVGGRAWTVAEGPTTALGAYPPAEAPAVLYAPCQTAVRSEGQSVASPAVPSLERPQLAYDSAACALIRATAAAPADVVQATLLELGVERDGPNWHIAMRSPLDTLLAAVQFIGRNPTASEDEAAQVLKAAVMVVIINGGPRGFSDRTVDEQLEILRFARQCGALDW